MKKVKKLKQTNKQTKNQKGYSWFGVVSVFIVCLVYFHDGYDILITFVNLFKQKRDIVFGICLFLGQFFAKIAQ